MKFKEDEKARHEKVVNKALIGKLLEITEGKYSFVKDINKDLRKTASQIQIQTARINTRNESNKILDEDEDVLACKKKYIYNIWSTKRLT